MTLSASNMFRRYQEVCVAQMCHVMYQLSFTNSYFYGLHTHRIDYINRHKVALKKSREDMMVDALIFLIDCPLNNLSIVDHTILLGSFRKLVKRHKCYNRF